MSGRARCALCLAVLLLVGTRAAQAEDLRERYGTKTLETAQLIDKAIALSEAKKPQEALKEIDAAIRVEDQCGMAHYWRALILTDLGRVDEALVVFKKVFDLGGNVPSNETVDAAINAGLLLGKLDKPDKAASWFTSAILADPWNSHGLRGKAYRNLAVTAEAQNKHLAAAVAAMIAFVDEPQNTPEQMVADFARQARNDEVAVILSLAAKPTKISVRAAAAPITPVDPEGAVVAENVFQLLSEPHSGSLIILTRDTPYYYLLQAAPKLTVRKVDFESKPRFGAVAGGRLFLLSDKPARIDQVHPLTGKVERSFDLGGRNPGSIAPLPSKGLIFFSSKGMVYGLHMKTGILRDMKTPGHYIAADPDETFLFAMTVHSPRAPETGDILLDGEPVFFPGNQVARGVEWSQVTLMRYILAHGNLLLADVRLNAASNGSSITVSPDGQWVAVAGGGGWHPKDTSHGAGYGAAVFNAHRLDQVQAYLGVGAYPNGIAFNPVTGQTAVTREKDARVFQLENEPKSQNGEGKDGAGVLLAGRCNGVAAWTSGGDYLVLANGDKGVRVYANPLSDPEKQFAGSWWKGLAPEEKRTPEPTYVPPPPLESVVAFKVKTSQTDARTALQVALTSGRTDRPLSWRAFEPYQGNDEQTQSLSKAEDLLKATNEAGIAVFQLRTLLKKYPGFVPAKFALAEGLRSTGQTAEARPLLEECIRADAGHTNLSCAALNSLAELYAGEKQDWTALYCLAVSLQLDRANPDTAGRAMPLLKANRLDAEAAKLTAILTTSGNASTRLPVLVLAPKDAKKLSSDQLFEKACPSIVLIKAGRGSGTGFCVARPGLILTNAHVLAGEDIVEVRAFRLENGKSVRLPNLSGEVIYRSDQDDVAALQLRDPPPSLSPLDLVPESPRPGEKVFAIGNPGFGLQILEQSISEGIISSNNRRFDRHNYLQHTAAVNPGNSGGPLLNEKCQVVGMITLKANLEGVSFAIPAEDLRKIFPTR